MPGWAGTLEWPASYQFPSPTTNLRLVPAGEGRQCGLPETEQRAFF